MKIRILISLLFPIFSIAQNSLDKEIYLDSLFNITYDENFTYSRVIRNYYTEQNEYLTRTYYKSGKLKMVGKTKNRDGLVQNGQFISYYENENKSEITNYDTSVLVGNYFSWYENGNKKIVGEFESNLNDKKKNPVLKINQFWNPDNIQQVIDGNGYYEEIDTNFHTISKGNIKNGLKDSVWNGVYQKRKITFSEEFKNGNMIYGTSVDSTGKQRNYKELNTKPLPIKGVQDFYNFIGKFLNIPPGYNNIGGEILLSFIIEKDGSISTVKVIKSLHPAIDSEAVKVLYKYPKWKPGLYRGIESRSLYSIPINISRSY